MGKPLPYYPMYALDFDEDPNVIAMNLAEEGLYLAAMNESWKRGSIPDDPIALAGLIRKSVVEVKKAWPTVRKCWVENGEPGRLVNPRLEKERKKAQEKSQSRSESARISHLDTADRPALASANAVGSQTNSVLQSISESIFSEGEEAVDFETFMHRWAHHRGFKKPPKQIREGAAMRWASIRISETDLGLGLDGYFDATWAKERKYPVMGFLKNPFSWIAAPAPLGEDEEIAAPTEEPSQPSVAPEASRPAQTTKKDLLVKWNTAVPGAFTEFEPKNLDEITPDLIEKFDEVCKVANGVLKNKPEKGSWLDFYWLLATKKEHSRQNWKRLITNLRWMAVSENPESGQKREVDPDAPWRHGGKFRNEAERNEAIEEQARANGLGWMYDGEAPQ